MSYFYYESLFTLSNKLKDTLKATFIKNEDVLDILFKINNILKNKCNHSKEDYIHLAGSTGSLIMVLECQDCSSLCYIEATKGLHHLTFAQSDTVNQAKSDGTSLYPPEVTASVQRMVISIIKHQSLPVNNFSQIEYLHLVISCLSILYNLVICAPEEVLGNAILNASHSFAFYKLPGIKEPEFQQESEDLCLNQEIGEIENDTSFKAYTNRNRRKRLRRKRPQPSRSTLGSDPTSLNGCMKERAVYVARMGPSSESLNELSLKPQWMQGLGRMGSDSGTSKDSAECYPSANEYCHPLVEGITALKLNQRSSLESSLPVVPSTTKDSVHCSQAPLTVTSSILELSENEFTFEDEEKISSLEARVRTCALYTINAVIKSGGRQNKFGFWPQLMCQNPSLMTCILRDPSASVRMVGLQVVNTFLTDSQQVLSMAVDDEGTRGSYTTLGRQLGSSIRELHRCLSLALLSERRPCLLVRILKTFELLVENVKYSNLKPGLLTKVVTHVKYFLRYKEAVVRANAFSVMVSFLMVKPQLAEMKDLLTKYRTPAPPSLAMAPVVRPPSPCDEVLPDEELKLEENDDPTSEESFSSDSCTEEGSERVTMVSWIVQRCLDSLLSQKRETAQGIYIQVQLQSLKVLSALVSEHLILIKGNLPLIQHVITVCCDLKPIREHPVDPQDAMDRETCLFLSPDPDVVVEHAFLLLGALLGSVKSHIERSKFRKHGTEVTNEEEEEGQCVTPSLALMLWLWALQDPLKILLEISCAAAQQSAECSNADDRRPTSGSGTLDYPLKPLVAAANVFSHLCLQVLESVGESVLNRILGVIRFLLSNSEPQLRLSGIRIMAIIAVYSPVGESISGPSLALSTIDLTTQLLSSRHSNVNKDRLLSAWALANVLSSLHVYRETARESGRVDFLGKATVMKVIRVAVDGCHDKDKIKPHAVRALGHALAFLSSDLASDAEVLREIETPIQTLLECCASGSNMRMRWNACHALGNILSSRHLPLAKASWRSPVLLQLLSLVEQFPNYKVRIQACVALCGVRQREVFGAEFALVWRAFLKGLDDAQNITDYHEIQHRDELITQLCVGLCQLVQLLILEDLESVTESLILRQDTAKTLLINTHETIPPEQSSCFLKAAEHLHLLSDSDALTASQIQGLNALLHIFTNFL